MSVSPPVSEGVSVHDRLLDAAEQVVARDGVANLTLDAVAREAGVSKGGLLYHFPSKSALITAVVERFASRRELDQQRAIENDTPDAPGAFTRAYVTARTKPMDPGEAPIHSALLAAAGSDPQYLDPFRMRFAKWQSMLESDGIDPVIATIVRLATDAMCLGTLLGIPLPQGELRRKVLDQLMAMTAPAYQETRKKE